MGEYAIKVKAAPIRINVSGAQGTPAVALLMKPPVANVAALPASGNSTNDGRVTNDTGMAYRWTGSSWILVGKFVGDRGPQGDQGDPGSSAGIVNSETAPEDTTVGWFDPTDGTTSYHNGFFWVTGSEIVVSGEGGGTTDPESELTDGTYFLDSADNFFASDTGEIFTDPLS